MKRIFACIFLAIGAITANADKWVKDAEPAILEVHYTRIEVYDTTMRMSRFFKDPVILRVGKDKSVFVAGERSTRISLTEKLQNVTISIWNIGNIPKTGKNLNGKYWMSRKR